jgi:phage anti-repressor protein
LIDGLLQSKCNDNEVLLTSSLNNYTHLLNERYIEKTVLSSILYCYCSYNVADSSFLCILTADAHMSIDMIKIDFDMPRL